MCQQKYFINYVLGVPDKKNAKAYMGNVVHKNLELLAKYKLAEQNGKKYLVDDNFGKITFKKFSLELINKLSYDYYENDAPGLMPPKAEQITLEWTKAAITKMDGDLDPRKQDIHAIEEFFEIEIPHEWAKYRYEIGGEVIEGQLGIKGTVDLIFKEDDYYLHVLDYKGLPVETKIPTPNGWSTMGDLCVGDFVFDQYGKQTKVIAKSSKKMRECFRIVFDDTSVVECDDEHYWKLLDGNVKQITELKIGDKIKVASPIDCCNIELPIDPYVLGVWLGDGRNRSCEITSGDKFIFEEIERRGFKVGKNQEKREVKCESRTIFDSTPILRKLDLLNNKHIPEVYLRSSYNQRLDLLRGLMDSDGSANNARKQCVFMNCNKRLSEDVKALLLTLGQRPLLSNTIAKGFGLEVNAYPVSFRPVGINPFLLPIKRDKVNWGDGNSFRRSIKNIEKIGIKETQCISVDSNDHTYLCTENMIPTHNTGRRYNWATEKVKTYECLKEDKQLLLYYYALRCKYPDKRFYISIYYINDHTIDKVLVEGGIFSFAFGDDEFKLAENMLRKEFESIKSNTRPRLLSDKNTNWKCKSLCAYSKIIPSISPDTPACLFLSEQIKKKGIDWVTSEYGDLSRMKTYDGGGRLNVDLEARDD
jgi:hypothetical protein